jgi:hypothetical protein
MLGIRNGNGRTRDEQVDLFPGDRHIGGLRATTSKEARMSRNYENVAGTVDKVRAIRSNKDEVLRLEVTVHIPTEFTNTYYGTENVTDDIVFSVPADSSVNPGDLAIINIIFASANGQRFQPALEVGKSDEDVLEVNVEDGMIEEEE